MTKTDIARRVYNHAWKLDPIVRSLLDTDFYKLLMLQMIWGMYPEGRCDLLADQPHATRCSSPRRSTSRNCATSSTMRATLRFSKKEMIWLAGNTFYGRKQIFEPEFLAWLADFQLPEYELGKRDGQYELDFPGPWMETTMWEIPALAIINELRSRAAMKALRSVRARRALCPRQGQDVGEGRAAAGAARICASPISARGAGTRFLWQRWCVEALKEGIGEAFTGTSNVLLAMDTDLEALGTNAHELPMVLAALARNEEELRDAPYKVLQDWQRYYGGNLLIVLPDAFGTAAFLRDAPDWVADWTGFRPDSAPPIEGGEKIIAWWREEGRDPREKLLIFSDGLDVETIIEDLPAFPGQGAHGFGWGTNLTNDFAGCAPVRDRRAQSDFARLQGQRAPMAGRRSSSRTIRQGDRR